ncbi:MAG: S1 RNA-binding domain-containing protein, partial [Clostridium sp.]|nr:S1 RNA-binding domain-containing protein [Clostridium sp.]
EGLIHINDLAWERVYNVEDVVKVGDKVEVFIGDVDSKRERLSLILKDVAKEPWEVHGDSLKEGEIFEGKVVRLTNFGAFVEVLPGIEGLVHITEITDSNIAKPSEVLKVGQKVKVKILNVDKNEKKLSLTIKDAIEKSNEYMQYNDSDEGVTLGDLFKDFKF